MLSQYLKKLTALFITVFLSAQIFSQNTAALLKEAQNLELKFDEPAALEKYKQIVAIDPYNLNALVKCVEYNCSIGSRQKDDKAKKTYYTTAKNFALEAYN